MDLNDVDKKLEMFMQVGVACRDMGLCWPLPLGTKTVTSKGTGILSLAKTPWQMAWDVPPSAQGNLNRSTQT